MNFLDEFGITDNEFQQMLQSYGISALDNFKCNINNAYKVRDYLEAIGVRNVKDILMGYLDFFKLDIEKVKYIFARNGVEETVSKVNDDFFILESLI